jgi:hypothetical protein
MASASTADAWRSGSRSDRSAAPRVMRPERGPGAERAARPLRATPPPPLRSTDAGRDHLRAPEDDMAYADAAEFARAPQRRQASNRGHERQPDRGRPERRPTDRARADERYRSDERRPGARGADPRAAGSRNRTAPAADTGGRRMRGIVVVLGIFLITLAGGAVDSFFMGMGLGLITLGCLVGSTVLAALMVRRRDLFSIVVAPPLVFMAVAAANIALAPSASFNLASMATLLVRGFPTMAIATGAAFVLALIRWAARR